MLSGSTCQSIRPLKPAWSFDLHFPILASVRTGDGHLPLSWFVAEGVLDAGDNFLAQLRISKVLQFDRDSHRAILSKRPGAQLSVQTGQSCAGWASQPLPRMTYSQFLLIKVRIEEKEFYEGFGQNRKGCDIGYALAASSCEEANSVETCTVAALDAITAFAVPYPNCPSQDQSVFSGLDALQVTLLNRSLSLLRIGKFYFVNPFNRRRNQN